MDKLKEKLKKGLKLSGSSTSGSSLFSTKPTAFAGTGHRLGTAEVKAPPPPRPPSAPSSSTYVPPATSSAPAVPTKSPLQAPPPPSPPPSSSSPTVPVSIPPEQPPLIDLAPQANESIISAIDQLSADPHCAASAQIISRLFTNILANPTEIKYRKVRLNNPKIQSAIVDTHGGVELVLACGFVIVFETPEDAQQEVAKSSVLEEAEVEKEEENQDRDDIEESKVKVNESEDRKKPGAEEGFAVLHEDADLEPLQAAVTLLQKFSAPAKALPLPSPLPPASQQQTQQPPAPGVTLPPPTTTYLATKEREWAAPCDRKTQVILPASVDTDVPSWFFERTGQDLKASFLAAVRKREQSQILMTKATRERLAKNGGFVSPSTAQPLSVPSVATVKVRLPEGISLQGEFAAGEPVVVVFAWVSDCLCDPLQTFDLVLPDRRILEHNSKATTSTTSGSGSGNSTSAAAIYSKRAAERPSSIKEAGLLPSVTLNLRWTGHSAVDMKGVPALRRGLYSTAAA